MFLAPAFPGGTNLTSPDLTGQAHSPISSHGYKLIIDFLHNLSTCAPVVG